MVFILTIGAFLVSVLASIADVKSLRIPNIYSLIISGLFFAAFLVSPSSFAPLTAHLLAGGIIFAVTFFMYAFKMFGSGDTKLASVLALWVGTKGLMIYLFYMALIGGVLGVAAIIIRRKKLFTQSPEGSWIFQLHNGRSAVPYGVAISIGAAASLFHTGFISKQLHELFQLIY